MFFVYIFFCYLSSMKIYKGVKIVETGKKKKTFIKELLSFIYHPFYFILFIFFEELSISRLVNEIKDIHEILII